MNLQTFLILLLILAVFCYLLFKEIRNFKTGESKCTSCTITDCPLAGLNIKTPTQFSECSCQSVSLEERQAILAKVERAKTNY